MKQTRQGLTLVEMLTVVSVIAILIGLLLPATSAVRRLAREAKQKTQFTAIGLALETFKNDFGQYPDSNSSPPGATANYCGAQKLAEALVGVDMLGFHPGSDLTTATGRDLTLYPDPRAMTPLEYQSNLNVRKGLYLKLDTANAFRLFDKGFNDGPGLYRSRIATNLDLAGIVLCDIFEQKPYVRQGDDNRGQAVKAGAPILYYRADSAKKTIQNTDPDLNIYNYNDNLSLINEIGEHRNQAKPGLSIPTLYTGGPNRLYEYIRDPSVLDYRWPYNPDSYILISAGQDGIYGTSDDIRNFGN